MLTLAHGWPVVRFSKSAIIALSDLPEPALFQRKMRLRLLISNGRSMRKCESRANPISLPGTTKIVVLDCSSKLVRSSDGHRRSVDCLPIRPMAPMSTTRGALLGVRVVNRSVGLMVVTNNRPPGLFAIISTHAGASMSASTSSTSLADDSFRANAIAIVVRPGAPTVPVTTTV